MFPGKYKSKTFLDASYLAVKKTGQEREKIGAKSPTYKSNLGCFFVIIKDVDDTT